MKKLILLLFVLNFSFSVYAQDDNDEANIAKKNIIKLNLPALAFKNISVQYERAVAKKVSVAATMRYMPDGSIPFKSSIIKLADDPETERQLNNLKVGNFAVMPELRYYLSRKGAFHGFYVGPFASIARYNASLVFEYDDGAITKTIPMNGSVNTFTGGLMLGAQWKLGKNIFLDWWILGANYGTSKGDIAGKKTLTPTEQQSLRNELANLDIPLTKFTYVVDGNGATVNFKGPWAGVRSGICIGFNF